MSETISYRGATLTVLPTQPGWVIEIRLEGRSQPLAEKALTIHDDRKAEVIFEAQSIVDKHLRDQAAQSQA